MITFRILAAVVVAVGVSGCFESEQDVSIKMAEDAVTARMRDPQSAEFKDVKYKLMAPGFWEVCGYVNAKNGFGGYVGFSPFIADSDKPPAKGVDVLVGTDSAGTLAILWKYSACNGG